MQIMSGSQGLTPEDFTRLHASTLLESLTLPRKKPGKIFRKLVFSITQKKGSVLYQETVWFEKWIKVGTSRNCAFAPPAGESLIQ